MHNVGKTPGLVPLGSPLSGDFPGNRDYPGKSLRLNGKYDFLGKKIRQFPEKYLILLF